MRGSLRSERIDPGVATVGPRRRRAWFSSVGAKNIDQNGPVGGPRACHFQEAPSRSRKGVESWLPQKLALCDLQGSDGLHCDFSEPSLWLKS